MNARTNTVRRGFCALGAAAVLGLGFAGPANARVDPGEPVPTVVGDLEPPRPEYDDDNALELLQVGGGILAGIALSGAAMALNSRRHHAGLHPA